MMNLMWFFKSLIYVYEIQFFKIIMIEKFDNDDKYRTKEKKTLLKSDEERK